jgi:glycosyltransferase involved in cell wall biosynthesis
VLLTVAICTRNPRPDYFTRVLKALAAQTVPPAEWRLLIVDSASDQALTADEPLKLGLAARVVRVSQPGILLARIAAITETATPLLVFLDDDNVPARDFIAEGLRIGSELPRLGCWGPGRIVAECEVPPSPEVKANLHRMVCWELPGDRWSNTGEEIPPGAGLFVRTSLAQQYARVAASDPRRGLIGETAGKLLRGEDVDLVFSVIKAGHGAGRFVALQLTHLIPKRRLTWAYVLDLARAQSSSAVVVNKIWGANPPRESLLDRLVFQLKIRRLPRLDRELALAQRAGDQEGRAAIAGW